ncbi:MAG: SURF1 family protein [Stenotrophobium sp.]
MAPARIPADAPTPRSAVKLAVLALAAIALFVGFLALGNWQVHRRAWKLDLIARVDQRIHAAPVAAPGRKDWPHIDAARDEYLHVRVSGEFLNTDETLVQASTRLGSGYWVLTPLRTLEGSIVLINRGFIPPDLPGTAQFQAMARPQGLVNVTGLLRLSEPHGGFLRSNQPAAHRWYSRDVAAIAAAVSLPARNVAPYFIDADATPDSADRPTGGLTVIHFRNSHLVYAITWYTLALMVAGGTAIIARHEWRLRRAGGMEKH